MIMVVRAAWALTISKSCTLLPPMYTPSTFAGAQDIPHSQSVMQRTEWSSEQRSMMSALSCMWEYPLLPEPPGGCLVGTRSAFQSGLPRVWRACCQQSAPKSQTVQTCSNMAHGVLLVQAPPWREKMECKPASTLQDLEVSMHASVHPSILSLILKWRLPEQRLHFQLLALRHHYHSGSSMWLVGVAQLRIYESVRHVVPIVRQEVERYAGGCLRLVGQCAIPAPIGGRVLPLPSPRTQPAISNQLLHVPTCCRLFNTTSKSRWDVHHPSNRSWPVSYTLLPRRTFCSIISCAREHSPLAGLCWECTDDDGDDDDSG
jgi:hypothetical protein